MSGVKVKICGLRRREDIEYVNQYKPDFIGFVFYEKSKRAVSAAQAQELKQHLDKQIKAVGVFVNAEPQLIARLVASKTIDLVQLHGDEDAAYCTSLRKLISVPLIKAVRVRDKSSLEHLEEYQADYLLLDTYQAGVYGGTGQRFNVELDAITSEDNVDIEADNTKITTKAISTDGSPDNMVGIIESKPFASTSI